MSIDTSHNLSSYAYEYELYLQLEKCNFEQTKIEYLGVIILHNKVKMDPVKITGVVDWPTPLTKKEVQSFVRFINFSCHFIPGFSHHMCALFNLTMKDVRPTGACLRKTSL
jgi:hypothetical protein